MLRGSSPRPGTVRVDQKAGDELLGLGCTAKAMRRVGCNTRCSPYDVRDHTLRRAFDTAMSKHAAWRSSLRFIFFFKEHPSLRDMNNLGLVRTQSVSLGGHND